MVTSLSLQYHNSCTDYHAEAHVTILSEQPVICIYTNSDHTLSLEKGLFTILHCYNICLATIAATAYTRGSSRSGLNNAVTVAQFYTVTDALLSLVASEASLLDELLLKDTVLPDVVLDLQRNSV